MRPTTKITITIASIMDRLRTPPGHGVLYGTSMIIGRPVADDARMCAADRSTCEPLARRGWKLAANGQVRASLVVRAVLAGRFRAGYRTFSHAECFLADGEEVGGEGHHAERGTDQWQAVGG